MRHLIHGLLASLLVVAACGDDDIRAADFDGQWVFTSLTVPTDSGPVTLVRDGAAQGIRGDAIFTATADDRAALDIRQVALADGLIAGDIQTIHATVVVEEDRWVITDPDGEVIVFTTARHEDHLVLTLDPTDPRLTATSPPTEVMLQRTTPWATRLVGDWDLVSMEFPSREVVADTCTELVSDVWVKLTMDIAIDERQLFERVMRVTRFTDGTCATPSEVQESLQVGYGEDDGVALRMWATEDGDAEFQAFSVATTGDTVTLTRTDCLPLPDCTDSAPLEVVVRRAP